MMRAVVRRQVPPRMVRFSPMRTVVPRQVPPWMARPSLRRTAWVPAGRPIGVPKAVLDQYVLHGYEPDNMLGFSLKPPRWLRKAQPGKILKKVAIPAAIVGAMFIPGVAPLALKAGAGLLKGGAGLLRGGFSAAKKIPGIFSRPSAVPTRPPVMGEPGYQYPTAGTPPFVPPTMDYPPFSPPPPPEAAYSPGGGGGGAPMMEYAAAPGPEEGAKLLGPGLLVVGGLVAVGLIASMASRRR